VIGAWPELSMLNPVWLAGAVGAEVSAFACNFGLQRLVLRTSGWFAVVTAGLVGNVVTAVLPGGDAAGASIQFRMLTAAGVDADEAAGGLTAAALLRIGASSRCLSSPPRPSPEGQRSNPGWSMLLSRGWWDSYSWSLVGSSSLQRTSP